MKQRLETLQTEITVEKTRVDVLVTGAPQELDTLVEIANQLAALKTRVDVLVNGAPLALDTLAEISAQLAADETGAAAILTTQGQHTTQIGTNTTQIAANTTAISGNTTQIAANTTAIGTNTTQIAANTTAIGTNTTQIATNTTAIGTNTTQIATNTTAIGTNATQITANTTAIGTNTTQITANTTAIGTKPDRVELVWHYIGATTNNNVTRLPLAENTSYGLEHYNNQYGDYHNNNTYGAQNYNNVYENYHNNNSYGSYHYDNHYGSNHKYNTYGEQLRSSLFGNNCEYLRVGANCSSLRVFNCKGTADVPFDIPAGTVGVEYRNNLVYTPIKSINGASPDTAGNITQPPPGTTLSADTQAALVGTTGIPSATNKYLTTTDPRLLSADTTNFVAAQAAAYSRFPADGSAPIGYATLAALGAAVTPGDIIRYNRSYTSAAAVVTFNNIWLDGQQNTFNLNGSNSSLTFSHCLIFDYELTTTTGASTITFTSTNNYVRGGVIGDFTVAAGATVVLDGVRSIGTISGTGTVILRGTTPNLNRVDTLSSVSAPVLRTFVLDDQRGVSAADLTGLPITYAELSAGITNSALVPGRYYKITDYQTIHVIPNTTAICENGVVLAATTTTYTGGNFLTNGGEPLVVQALSPNKLALQATSPAFPQDVIEYDPTPVLIGNATFHKGTITRRKDTVKNIETQYDFRTVKFRRWKATGVLAFSATATGSVLTVATNLSTTSQFMIRSTNGNTALITTVQFNDATVSLPLPLPVSYLIPNTINYLIVTLNGAPDSSTGALVSTPLLETRVSNKYIGTSAAENQPFGTLATTLVIDPATFQDMLTFGNYPASSNVVLGKNPTLALPNVVFGSSAANVSLLDAATSTFAGAVNSLRCESNLLRMVTVLGDTTTTRFQRMVSNVLVANQSGSSPFMLDALGNVSNVGGIVLLGFLVRSTLSKVFFHADANNYPSTLTLYAATNALFAGGMYESKFYGTLTNAYVGQSAALLAGNLAGSTNLIVYNDVTSCVFGVTALGAVWCTPVVTSSVSAYIEGFTVSLTSNKKYYTMLPNATTGTLLVREIGSLTPTDITFNAGGGGTPFTDGSVTVPKLAADVLAKLNAAQALFMLPELTATQNGGNTLSLPALALGVVTLLVSEVGDGSVRALYPADYSVTNAVLTVSANANLLTGDKISGTYYAAALDTITQSNLNAYVETIRTQVLTSAIKTTDYTLALADAGNIVPFTAAATVTIPPNVFAIGTVIEIAQESPSQVIVVAGAGVTLRSFTGHKTPGQWASVGLRQRSPNEWVITNAVE